MGCLVSSNTPEHKNLFQEFESGYKRKNDLLYEIQSLKINQHVKTSHPSLKNVPENQIGKTYLDSKLKELALSLRCLEDKETEIEEADYNPSIENLRNLLEERDMKEAVESELKSFQALFKSLTVKVKENVRICKELDEHNITLEDLQLRKDNLQETNDSLIQHLDEIKSKILELNEHLKLRKLRKRRFTVISLPPNRMQLRSKILMKQEFLKKIELAKLENERKRNNFSENKYQLEPQTPHATGNDMITKRGLKKRWTMIGENHKSGDFSNLSLNYK